MAHYDLYKSLNLDSNASSADLVAELDSLLQQGKLDNLGGAEEIELAKKILGDEQKREQYDSRLADPSSPEITVANIRKLASNPSNNQNQSDSRGRGFNAQIPPEKIAAVKSTFNSAAAGATDRARDVQAEYKKSSRTAIIITAVAAFIAGGVIVGLVGSMLGGGGRLGASGVDYKGAEEFANSFLELRGEEETRDWIIENTDASNRNGMLDYLDISNDGRYTGMDSFFGENELTAGTPISLTEYFRSVDNSTQDFVEEYADEESVDEAASDLLSSSVLSAMTGSGDADIDPSNEYFLVPIIGDGEYGDSTLSVVKDDNKWILSNFSRG